MSRTMRVALLFGALSIAALPSVADAHPGHGTSEPSSLWHYVTEPLHVAGAVGAVIIASVMVYRAWRVLSSFSGR